RSSADSNTSRTRRKFSAVKLSSEGLTSIKASSPYIADTICRRYHKPMNAETPASERITVWLTDMRGGDANASERLFEVVHPQLRRIAARFLHNERDHHTLEPNALVNELYLRLIGSAPIDFKDRAHFFAIAAQTMRRILIDYARARVADKRGGEQQ